MSKKTKSSGYKRSFIPKSLRPEVPGQHLDIENINRQSKNNQILESLSLNDILETKKRRETIIQIISSKEKEDNPICESYKNALISMFPKISSKVRLDTSERN